MCKVLYIPVVGLAVAFVRHFKAVKNCEKNPSWEAEQATWQAFGNYHIALVCTLGFSLASLAILRLLK